MPQTSEGTGGLCSLALVKAFLKYRCMTVTIGGEEATPVVIRKGSPQGSVLGCLLCCITTQLLSCGLQDRGPGADDDVVFFPQDDENNSEVIFWNDVNPPPRVE